MYCQARGDQKTLVFSMHLLSTVLERRELAIAVGGGKVCLEAKGHVHN